MVKNGQTWSQRVQTINIGKKQSKTVKRDKNWSTMINNGQYGHKLSKPVKTVEKYLKESKTFNTVKTV